MIIKKDIDMVVRIIEENILPQFKDIIGIFKDEWKDKRKPIFEKIATQILTKLKEHKEKKEE